MRNQRTSRRRLLTRVGFLVAVVAGLAVVYSCSLIVDTQSQQCQSNSDCAGFPGATCNTTLGVCVGTSSEGGSGEGCDVDGGINGGGCYNTSLAACVATSNAQLLNACTTGCTPFDNSMLKGFVDAGFALPDLPVPGPDGGL
jgi:hypothetical protein